MFFTLWFYVEKMDFHRLGHNLANICIKQYIQIIFYIFITKVLGNLQSKKYLKKYLKMNEMGGNTFLVIS